MKLSLKRGEKGFTLVELMVVMAIIAVLAAVIVPSVSGNKQVSTDTQNKQDASSIQTSVHKYNVEQNNAESVRTVTTGVVGESPTAQVISSKWPEKAITEAYSTASFPATTTTVTGVTIKDKSGTTTYATSSNSTTSLDDFVAKYNAIDFGKLTDGGYIQATPNGADAVFSTAKPYNNYLYLLKKVLVDSAADAGRVVEVYSLTTVTTSDSTDALVYQRIF